MKHLIRAIAFATIMAGAGIAAAAGDTPNSFRVQIPLRAVPGASVQRITLPGRLLVALQRADLGDVRVFDAKGQAMQIALADPRSTRAAGRRLPLKAYPILGSPGALKVTGLSLKFDDLSSARVVGVDGAVTEPRGAVVLGALLDTRRLATPAAGLLLDADVPASQPVTFKVEASADLADWQPVAEKVIYRAPADRAIASETIDLAGADLNGRYLRISWSAGSRLLSPVTVRGATLITADRLGADRVTVEATIPAPADPHELRFALPFRAPLAALRIVPVAATAVIPIRLFGREDREQAWTPIGEATISPRGERSNGAIAFPDRIFREIRIEADARSPGFATAPRIELQFEARDIAAVLSGTPPFVLAGGSDTAETEYLGVRDLVPDGRLEDVPAAIPADGPPATLALPPSVDGGTPRQTIILWAALLLGTLALGGIVWALYRSMKAKAPPGIPPAA